MSEPVVGPGPHSRSEIRAWADAQIRKNAEAAAKKPKTPEAKRLAYNARQAAVMRKRRKDPRIRQREKTAIKARDTAYRRLAAAFPEDFLRILNDERIRQGIPILVPRRRRTETKTTVPVQEAPAEKEYEPRFVEKQQGVDPATCKHNEGIKKFAYGKFCIRCAKMIK